MSIFTIFSSNKKFPKSKKENGFWTFLKMSKNRIVKEVPKSTQKSRCDQYAHNDFFDFYKIVTINFSFLRPEL